MHEFSLMADLVKKINKISTEQNAEKVIKINIKLGALSHISADHFKEHFVHVSKGTNFENAELEIEEASDVNASDAQDILLESIEVI